MNDKFLEDKNRVLAWMQKYANGYRAARTRENILPFVQLKDRYFRSIASELIHEGNLCSSHKRGYWFPPLATNNTQEITAYKECQIERKAKALDLITDCDGLIKYADELLAKVKQGQLDFANFGQRTGLTK